MKTIDYRLTRPCTELVPHVAHAIDLIGPTGVFVALCPGFQLLPHDPDHTGTLDT